MGMRGAGGHSAVREKVGMRIPHSRIQIQLWRLLLCCAHRMKLLLGLCIIFALFALAKRASGIMGWSLQPMGDALHVSRNGYTVLVNTWKRDDLLKKSVAHYRSCDNVAAIRIVWSENQAPSDALQSFCLKTASKRSNDHQDPFIKFIMHLNNSLNNRFKPIEGVKTEAIFSIDDDVLIPCSTLEFAFSIWQTAPNSMVGFVPRMHWMDTKRWMQKQGSVRPLYVYGGWWSVWWTGTYSMILSKAAFVHHKYLDAYTNQMPFSIRSFVQDKRNCEDIAMSFLVANITHAPPIWVKGKMYETGLSGISSLKGHSKHRTDCLNHFVSVYGGMPLVASTVKAIDAHNECFW